jgi:hypothetical protein
MGGEKKFERVRKNRSYVQHGVVSYTLIERERI